MSRARRVGIIIISLWLMLCLYAWWQQREKQCEFQGEYSIRVCR